MNRYAITIAFTFIATAGLAAAGPSRLETDFQNQMSCMHIFDGTTDEPSCGGTYLKIFTLGGEIRLMEWNIETSQKIISRAIYFGRGKPQLIIETTFCKLDDSGNELRNPKRQYIRRYWLNDATAGPAGIRLRRELRDHAKTLVKYFAAHKNEFQALKATPQQPASAEATAKKKADKFAGDSETIGAAKSAGYDYLQVVSDCLLRKESAMHELFVMSKKAHFDAAASEGHSSVLRYILSDTGDRFFGELLAREPADIRQSVRDHILYDLGYGDNTSITESEIRRMYPKTFPNSFKF